MLKIRSVYAAFPAFTALAALGIGGISSANAQSVAHPSKAQTPKPSKVNSDFFKAAKTGDVEEMQRLLKQGANVNARDGHGNTPLVAAVKADNRAMVELLLNAGADPKLETTAGPNTNLFESTNVGMTPLNYYSGGKGVLRLMMRHGADINHPSSVLGWTPLMSAVNAGNLIAIIRLVKAGADLSITSKAGRTALSYAEDPLESQPNKKTYSAIAAFLRSKTKSLAPKNAAKNGAVAHTP